ncbi:MAG: hypothetical protein VX777_07620 [Chlamydiota bacterium]|nr:hypothetical protein [Chlamydiota bacterium]
MSIFGYSSVSSMISSRNEIDTKKIKIAATYPLISEVLQYIFGFLNEQPTENQSDKRRLYRHMTSSENLERFLPDDGEARSIYWGSEKRPGRCKEDYLRISSKCVHLFKAILTEGLFVDKFINQMFEEVISLNKEINKDKKNRWFWESSWDYTVDLFYGSSKEEGISFDDKIRTGKQVFADTISKYIKVLTKQEVLTEKVIPLEKLTKQTKYWENQAITISSWADRFTHPGLSKIHIKVASDHLKEYAEISFRKIQKSIVVSEIKFIPKKNSGELKDHVVESVAYRLFAEILALNKLCESVKIVPAEPHDCQVNDTIAKAFGLSVEYVDGQNTKTWTLSKDTAEVALKEGSLILNESLAVEILKMKFSI